MIKSLLSEPTVYFILGVIIVVCCWISILDLRWTKRNKNTPKFYRRQMWLIPLLVAVFTPAAVWTGRDLATRSWIILMGLLACFLGYRLNAKKLKQALQAENKNEEQGEVVNDELNRLVLGKRRRKKKKEESGYRKKLWTGRDLEEIPAEGTPSLQTEEGGDLSGEGRGGATGSQVQLFSSTWRPRGGCGLGHGRLASEGA